MRDHVEKEVIFSDSDEKNTTSDKSKSQVVIEKDLTKWAGTGLEDEVGATYSNPY